MPSRYIDIPPDSETESLARYLEHVRECESCDTGAGQLCHVGMVRHRAWRQAAEQQA